MEFFTLHGIMVILSALASLGGLVVLHGDREMEENQHLLLSMTFGCWLVYCAAWSMLRITPPDIEDLSTSLRVTCGVAYLFTFASVLSLPLCAVNIPVD
jgi:hypothetical protein